MSNLVDVVSGANLFGGVSYSFVPDRFCSPNSAIYFNKGYLQIPEGVYFPGDFTLTAWIYLKSYQFNSRIFDFGSLQTSDNVVLAMLGNTSQMNGKIYKGTVNLNFQTFSIINLNQWYFISFVFTGTTQFIYLNGNQLATGNLYGQNNINKIGNYIGKSNWGTDLNADAIYDELKIYQGALSSNEIINEYKNSSNNGNLINIIFNFNS